LHVHTIAVSPEDRSVEVRLPPFDFHWRWHENGGAPPASYIGDRGGRLGVDARSGSVSGAADRFVGAHTGVGCLLRTDRQVSVELFAGRQSRYSFGVGARGIGANATSEGRLETTLMRGPKAIMGGTFPLWRRRVSGPSEDARYSTDFANGVYPNGMGRLLEPGEYVFNAGIWAFTDYSSGVGGAAAQSLVQSNILEMRIHRR
jgi:hypothetical protein